MSLVDDKVQPLLKYYQVIRQTIFKSYFTTIYLCQLYRMFSDT